MFFFRWQSGVDFVVLAAALYAVLRWAHSARALRIALGVLGLHTLALLARHLDLVITSWVLDPAAIRAIILLLLVFQLELRWAFMRLDRAFRHWLRSRSAFFKSNGEICYAVFGLAVRHLGALFVIVRGDAVSELVEGGIVLDAEISNALLKAIFQQCLLPTSP
jgi:diadenylate cyclase